MLIVFLNRKPDAACYCQYLYFIKFLAIFKYLMLLLFQMYGQQYDYNRQMTGYPGYGAAYYHR